ncbi:chromosome segregation ATPase [Burkholderia latens]|uniref:Chromosome segregation ATPase n=1 Tax=Burkholderia latens TaxID=488446 RepID=A0A6P2HIR0_9BURK|nr:chromosome segregation ATPase [Burkholderia latens]
MLDSDDTVLFVVDKPVDNELAVVDVDVDSDVTLLLVVDRPVDSELTPVDSELAVVEVDVDSELTARFVAFSCEPLIASVLVALIRPAATFVI